MNANIRRGFVMTVLIAAGCGNGGSGVAGGGAAGPAGGTGTAGAGTAGNTGTAGAPSPVAGAAGTGTTPSGGASAGGTSGSGSGTAGTTGGGGATVWAATPQTPPALVVPQGATLALHVHAVGAQIYTCTAVAGAAGVGAPNYSWVFKAPDAKLYDSSGAQVGTHGAGPSWMSSDGSVVNGTKIAELSSPSPDAISWLLLRASSTSGTGTFSDVTYVQRLDTTGGQAPVTGCDSTSVGMDLRVGYTAEYYFYTGGAGAAWLTPPANLPAAIAVPQGMTLKLHDRGIGTQIYACLASDSGPTTYAWVFKAPNALLLDMSYGPVGMHGMGPSWTSSDGSSLTAKELARADSPLPDAIPWLLLKEFSTSGAGEFSDVAIVQRVNTAGGKAPETVCDATTVDTLTRVFYSADYYFYVSVDAPDGGAGG